MTGFLVAPRVLPFTVAVMIDGNGRRGRDAGNDGFLMDRGRDGCREGESGEASGDETRGRFVLIASDMSELVGSRWIWVSKLVRECNAGEVIWGYLRATHALNVEGQRGKGCGAR